MQGGRAAGDAPTSFAQIRIGSRFYFNGRETGFADADVAEGADMLMVKPAGPYLDVLLRIRETFALPLCAYQVSGEYSMLMAAIENGWLNKDAAILESLLGIRRAGADFILSYFTEYLLEKGLVR